MRKRKSQKRFHPHRHLPRQTQQDVYISFVLFAFIYSHLQYHVALHKHLIKVFLPSVTEAALQFFGGLPCSDRIVFAPVGSVADSYLSFGVHLCNAVEYPVDIPVRDPRVTVCKKHKLRLSLAVETKLPADICTAGQRRAHFSHLT